MPQRGTTIEMLTWLGDAPSLFAQCSRKKQALWHEHSWRGVHTLYAPFASADSHSLPSGSLRHGLYLGRMGVKLITGQ